MVTAIAAFVMVASSLPARASAWTEGGKTLLFMRVDFSDMPGEPLTVAAAQSLINSDVNNFYIQNSYNKTSLSVTVVPTVLRMPQTTAFYGADNHVQLLDDARAAALSAGYNSANYDLDIVAFDYISAFEWAGLGYVGGKGTWLNGYFDLHVTGHEVGHNYGLGHANLWDTTDGSVIGAGSSYEYGDLYDVMGSGGTTGSHFNAFFKNRLDWILPAGVNTVTSSGTYRIQQQDSIASNGVRALKIAKDGSTNYWVEFRQALTTNNWVMNGAVLHWGYNFSTESDLLDTTPETTSANDAALLIGRTFSDTNAGIHITPIGKGGTSPESLDVVVNIGNFAGNQAPTLSINPTSGTTNSGTAINFTATASDANGDTLSYCWDFGDTTFSSVANPTKSWTTGGTFTVRCTVSDRKGGTASATATITVVATYIVTNTNDSGAGSLRAAINFANANTGSNIIFNIPTSSSGYQSGVFSIKPLSALPSLNSTGTIMDGATQTAFTGNTNTSGPEVMIDGTSAGTSVYGLTVYGSNCAIKNLVISGFSASGMQMAGASANNNTVQGCYIGTNASGTAALANSSRGILLYAGAHHNTFGGTGAGQGNVISGNGGYGIEFQQANTNNNVVQGNYIGTNAAGTGAIANNVGIIIWNGAQNNTIGGSAAARNVISGNGYAGIYLNGGGTTATSGNIVQSNYIGVDANGANAIPNHFGVQIYGGNTNNVTNNVIGGVGNGNLIASNGGDGISVENGCVGNSIRANAIYGNGGLGINLVGPSTGYGVNANDAGDADSGGNNWQNFPVITGATGGSSGTVNFTLNSIANRVYTIDVFRNTAADSSGYGEGAVYVGSQNVSTDGSGNANGSLTFSNVPGGLFFTTTATDTTTGDTSEFGQATQMTLTPASLQFSSAAYNVSESGVSATITVTRTGNSDGAVSVNYATSNGTATAGSDYTAATSTLSWNSGDTTDKTFTVPITDDTSLEADETVNLTLSSPGGSAVLGTQNTALLTITDNESVLTIADATAAIEGSAAEPGTVTFALSLSPASNQSVTVDYTTTNGTALAGSDYTAKNGTITFAPGQTSQSVTISLIGDAVNEATETFSLTLANASGATITDAQGVGTISDDDIAPSVSIGDASVTEGDTGSVNAVFAVTLSAASSQTVTVSYATANGTTNPATVSSDYTAANGALTFNAGETTKSLNVVVKGDYVVEANETFFVNLSNATNVTIADGQGIGTITNDDSDSTVPTVSFTTASTTPAGTTPVSGSTIYNVMPTITGVAADSGSGVAKVELRLHRVVNSVTEFWNGTAWGTTQVRLAATLNPTTGGANVSWSKGSGWPTGGNLSEGTYYLTAYATDKAAKVAAVTSSFKVLSDTVVPTVSFTTASTTPAGTTPVSGSTIYNVMPTITGVAADSGSGIAKVELRLHRVVNSVTEFWGGTSWGTTQVKLAATLNPANGGANVSWSKGAGWPTGGNLSEGTYYLTAYATDKGAKVASASSNFKLLNDTTVPTVSFTTASTTPAGTTPVSGSTIYNVMPTITGVAADSGSGVAKVELRLHRVVNSVVEFWNGTAWTTTNSVRVAAVLNPTTGGANVSWSKSDSWPTGANLTDNTYYLTAYAYDKVGKIASASSNFKKASSAPLTQPVVASPSSVMLSTVQAWEDSQSIELTFTGALEPQTASRNANYIASVNGVAVEVQNAVYNTADTSVTLQLAVGTLQKSDVVNISWNLQDSSGKPVTGQTKLQAE
jgi:hypothetical protein